MVWRSDGVMEKLSMNVDAWLRLIPCAITSLVVPSDHGVPRVRGVTMSERRTSLEEETPKVDDGGTAEELGDVAGGMGPLPADEGGAFTPPFDSLW